MSDTNYYIQAQLWEFAESGPPPSPNGQLSIILQVKTESDLTPSTPTGITATPDTTTLGTVNLGFNASTGTVSRYEARFRVGNGNYGNPIQAFIANGVRRLGRRRLAYRILLQL